MNRKAMFSSKMTTLFQKWLTCTCLHYITVSVTFTSCATAVLVHDCLVIAKSQFTAKLTSHCCLKFNGN